MTLFHKIKNITIKGDKTDNTIDEKKRRIQSLSAREYETFRLLLEGNTLRACAEKMGIKFSTVNTYQNSIYKKLGVNNRANLIIYYRDIV